MRWNPVQAGFRTSSCMVCGFLLPSFSLFLLQSYSFGALINTANFFSSEKHGVPERKTLEKRKRARYIISNG